MDSSENLTFLPDKSFIQSGVSLGEYTIFGTGKWYVDYKRILVRYKPLVSAPDDSGEERLIIINVADVTSDELKISHKDWVETYRRVKTLTREEIQSMAGNVLSTLQRRDTKPREASNQTMQRTAGSLES
jgi:hypothetical protein